MNHEPFFDNENKYASHPQQFKRYLAGLQAFINVDGGTLLGDGLIYFL